MSDDRGLLVELLNRIANAIEEQNEMCERHAEQRRAVDEIVRVGWAQIIERKQQEEPNFTLRDKFAINHMAYSGQTYEESYVFADAMLEARKPK